MRYVRKGGEGGVGGKSAEVVISENGFVWKKYSQSNVGYYFHYKGITVAIF